jgi:hypothetical protein
MKETIIHRLPPICSIAGGLVGGGLKARALEVKKKYNRVTKVT